MGILYTSGLCTVKGARERRDRDAFLQDFRGSETSIEHRLLRMGVSIVEFNALDICFIIFNNSSHRRLIGVGGGGGSGDDEW